MKIIKLNLTSWSGTPLTNKNLNCKNKFQKLNLDINNVYKLQKIIIMILKKNMMEKMLINCMIFKINYLNFNLR